MIGLITHVPFIIEHLSLRTILQQLSGAIKSVPFGYKCLICKGLGQNPHGFKKPNGEYYIEAHHVTPVSSLEKGTLAISNIITVCANHHRQLHYGNSELMENIEDKFVFKIDGQRVEVRKLRTNNRVDSD